ncbi:hypothetical protein DN752_22995 [Echinicola strongylocentroti]|uniref:Right handed beta helix domain-containing protein n=1 Tax=Echinicola strongylocentroti TaxID=1795355 RepID=A0A2Z4IQ72_9BACT|nr:right-handed parallel beta-helix repeat-containing protein [Echinicola strongylocentroti]AWW32778.1 hypothetical protein DN752_22995 [Echinicola strongylocentroti]
MRTIKNTLTVLFFCLWSSGYSQELVGSLDELLPYLSQDGAEVTIAPGTYTITAADIAEGRYQGITTIRKHKGYALLLFEGNNSTYDFTDVTINVETAGFSDYGDFDEFYEVQVTGNDNIIKNLTLTDVGSVHDYPKRRACNIVMDGANNRIEGFHVTTRGSFPYGYGESFGKGGNNVIGHYKHSALLVRGYKNHVKNCSIIHRSYGHAIFMQAADKPLIEGCYVEGQMRSTDDMLEEEGTGSEADKVDFMTYFDYKLPQGYMLSLGEEGIRAYNGGETIIDGVEYVRGTSNPTILNCTVKNMRAGVTLTHATGTKYVEGCVVIGCERGYCIGSGDIVDCYADTQYGPALGVDYATDHGTNAEITLLPYDGPSYNGSKHAAIIIGHDHYITLKGEVPDADQDLKINVGGDNRTIGLLKKDENYPASNIVLHNLTGYPVVMDDNSKGCTGISVGSVTDQGRNNHVFEK